MALKQKTSAKTVTSKKAAASFDLDNFKSEIEKRAKEIFLKRQKSQAPGDELSDWLWAEKEVKSKLQMS
jgi:hypothetical protein